MQSKWFFRWKIRATALYLRRLGFKPLFRSQVKISLVLLSFLTFVLLTEVLFIQAPSGVTGSPGSKAGCPWLQRKRILSVMCLDMGEKREPERGGEKRGKNSKFSLVLAISSNIQISCLLFFLVGNKNIGAELYFWLLIVKGLLLCLGYPQNIHNICSFSLPTHTKKWMGKIIL